LIDLARIARFQFHIGQTFENASFEHIRVTQELAALSPKK